MKKEKELKNLDYDDFLEYINDLKTQSDLFNKESILNEFREFSERIIISNKILKMFEEEFINIKISVTNDNWSNESLKEHSIITKLWKDQKVVKILY